MFKLKLKKINNNLLFIDIMNNFKYLLYFKNMEKIEYIKEYENSNYSKPIPYESCEIIHEQMIKCICKIDLSPGSGTGFFVGFLFLINLIYCQY